MGLPLISTRTPGCEDVVQHGRNGYLVEAEATDELVQAIERLIGQPNLRRRFGAASRKVAVHRFDLSVIARETGRLYRQLLRGEMSFSDATLNRLHLPAWTVCETSSSFSPASTPE